MRTVDALTPAERENLFSTFERDAFHLEMRDEYHVADEVDPLRKWRDREWTASAASEWWEPWLAKVRKATSEGRTIRRLRIVTEPITEYTRFLWEGTRYNVSAGEDVRWLPRALVPEQTCLPEHDFWLFDDSWAVFNHFDDGSLSMHMERVTDPGVLQRCVSARDRLWMLGVPHHEFAPGP